MTAQGENDLFYLSNIALNYSPKKLKGWDFSLKALDILNSNTKGLNTRVYNDKGEQVFFQETEYLRQGTIVELSVSYKFNLKRSKKKSDKTFGNKEF